jgi:hypothetical protein
VFVDRLRSTGEPFRRSCCGMCDRRNIGGRTFTVSRYRRLRNVSPARRPGHAMIEMCIWCWLQSGWYRGCVVAGSAQFVMVVLAGIAGWSLGRMATRRERSKLWDWVVAAYRDPLTGLPNRAIVDWWLDTATRGRTRPVHRLGGRGRVEDD